MAIFSPEPCFFAVQLPLPQNHIPEFLQMKLVAEGNRVWYQRRLDRSSYTGLGGSRSLNQENHPRVDAPPPPPSELISVDWTILLVRILRDKNAMTQKIQALVASLVHVCESNINSLCGLHTFNHSFDEKQATDQLM